jgi:hypothetical protein
MGSNVNLVLESETRTLSAHEVWVAVGAVLVACGLLFWFFMVLGFNMMRRSKILGMVVKDGGADGKEKK